MPLQEAEKFQENLKQNLNAVEGIAKNKVDPTKVGKKLDEKNKDQNLGLADKMLNDKVTNVVNFVNRNDALITEYTITGIADGHKFEDGGPNAQAIRNQCGELIREMWQKMVLPAEYQSDYLNNLNNKNPNEILALTRALLVLSQLPKETLDKIGNKLTRDIHTEEVKSWDFRTGELKAYAPNGTFDMTEDNNIVLEKIPVKLPELKENTDVKLDKMKAEWREQLKNILPRIDFVMQMPNPKNSKETRQFQKQVNTDGTSKTGWYPITPITYNYAIKHINMVDLWTQEANRPKRLNNIWSDITGKWKYEAVLDVLNKDEDKNKQIRSDAAKQYLTNLAENPSPQMSAFVQKVETALGKWWFKTFMNEVYTLGL